jgi:hypothetical protein
MRMSELHSLDHLGKFLLRGTGGFICEDAMLFQFFLNFQQLFMIIVNLFVRELSFPLARPPQKCAFKWPTFDLALQPAKDLSNETSFSHIGVNSGVNCERLSWRSASTSSHTLIRASRRVRRCGLYLSRPLST